MTASTRLAIQTDGDNDSDDLKHQFDTFPYPGHPLPAKLSPRQLYFHSVQSAWWRIWHRNPADAPLSILDAGCGSGRTALLLASANPQAQVLGVDLSEKSISMARDFAARAGLANIQFECRSLCDMAPLERTFDYINADEVLYLAADPNAVVSSLGAMLNPNGVLRANFHWAFQRSEWLRFQKFFAHLGFLSGEASELKVGAAREVIASLNPKLPLVARHRKAMRM